MANELLPSEQYQHPDQPRCLYDNTKSWEQNRIDGPNWKGSFPQDVEEHYEHLKKDYDFLGFGLKSPIAIAAGPGAGLKWNEFYMQMGYALIVDKTHRTVLHPSNEKPNLAIPKLTEQLTLADLGRTILGSTNMDEYDGDIANSYGNPENQTLFQIMKEMQKQHNLAIAYGSVLFASITATIDEKIAVLGRDQIIVHSAGDVTVGGSLLVMGGAEGIEDNKACPNVGPDHPEGQMYQDPKMIKAAADEFHGINPGIPFGVKFGVFPSKEAMKRVFAEVGDKVDYWSGINTLGMEVLDENGQAVLPGRPHIGVSGRHYLEIGLQQTKWAADIKREEGLHYSLLMGAGIYLPQHVDMYLDSGADCTQIGNTALFNPLFNNDYLFYRSNLPR